MKTNYLGKFKWGRNNNQQFQKIPMCISNLMQQKYFKCYYHDADDMFKFMQFYENVDMSIMNHLSKWQKRKGCHDNEFENDAMATYRFR